MRFPSYERRARRAGRNCRNEIRKRHKKYGIKSQLLGIRTTSSESADATHATVATTTRIPTRSIFACAMGAHTVGMKKNGKNPNKNSSDQYATDPAILVRLIRLRIVYHSNKPRFRGVVACA